MSAPEATAAPVVAPAEEVKPAEVAPVVEAPKAEEPAPVTVCFSLLASYLPFP